MPSMCRHCTKRRANRPRGLCWACYYVPGLRDRYGTVGDDRFARRGVPDTAPTTMPVPTRVPPGSDAKVAVLAGRARRGECLWHPDDATHEDERHAGIQEESREAAPGR